MLGVDIIKGSIIGAAGLILHLVISVIMYNCGIYIPIMYMIVSSALLIVGIIFFHYLMARSERVKINNAFLTASTTVSAAVVSKLGLSFTAPLSSKIYLILSKHFCAWKGSSGRGVTSPPA